MRLLAVCKMEFVFIIFIIIIVVIIYRLLIFVLSNSSYPHLIEVQLCFHVLY